MAKKPALKRTCNLCKASVLEQGCGYTCSLGYDVDRDLGVPKEVCPKPTSYTMLVAIQHINNKNGKDV